jgi:predicted glutamine amidotransferase
MCRFVAAVGRWQISEVLRAALHMSCGHTASHERAEFVHRDGWGMILGDASGKRSVSRRESPLRDGDLRSWAGLTASLVAVHVRHASRSEQVGLAYVHPLAKRVAGENYYFLHQGYAPDVYRLLGRRQAHWDSMDLFDWLLPAVRARRRANALLGRLELLPNSTTAANFVMVGGCEVIVGHWFPAESSYPRYNQLHWCVADGVVVASDILESLRPREEWRLVPRAAILELRWRSDESPLEWTLTSSSE